MARFKIEDHVLVPKHSKLSKEETQSLLAHYHLTTKDLPRIRLKDPAIAHLNVKENDVILIERNSQTAGPTRFYRRVSRD